MKVKYSQSLLPDGGRIKLKTVDNVDVFPCGVSGDLQKPKAV